MDQLWDYEVVEVFFLGRSNRYLEIEMSPHGHFLVLKLHGARNLVETMIPIDYHAGQVKVGNVTRWTGVARIPKTLMPDGPYYWNAYSIHGVDENRRYLSLYPVPGPGFHDDAPDFHRIHCFRYHEPDARIGFRVGMLAHCHASSILVCPCLTWTGVLLCAFRALRPIDLGFTSTEAGWLGQSY